MSTKKKKQQSSGENVEKEQAAEVTKENEDTDTQRNGSPEQNDTKTGELKEQESYIARLEERIKELEQENSELKSQYLRKQADFENFRKRMQREKKEAIEYANSNLLLDLVSIIDDFERAIKSSEESKDFESFHSGIKLIEKQFVGMLERKYGLTRMESEGKEFDPQKHEAINMEENPDYDVQTVVEDYQRGYMLHDRVLRHSKVKVALPASGESPVTDETDESAGASEEKAPSDSSDQKLEEQSAETVNETSERTSEE